MWNYTCMRNRNSFSGIALLITMGALIAGAITGIIFFMFKAIRAGKIMELLISTSVLALVYFSIYSIEASRSGELIQMLLWWTPPFIIYAVYWMCLLVPEKSPIVAANNLSWADKNWWWTLDGWEFEEEVSRVFKANGCKTRVTKKTGDGGIDIILYKDNLKYIVQCKHYKEKLSPEPMRALWGCKDDFGADGVIMVASSGVTDSSKDYIKNKDNFIVYTLNDIIRMGTQPSNISIKKPFGNGVPIPSFLP